MPRDTVTLKRIRSALYQALKAAGAVSALAVVSGIYVYKFFPRLISIEPNLYAAKAIELVLAIALLGFVFALFKPTDSREN